MDHQKRNSPYGDSWCWTRRKFSQLRQKPGASIGELKKEFDLQLDAFLGAAVPATAQPELEMLFINELDPQRYAGILTYLTNDAKLGTRGIEGEGAVSRPIPTQIFLTNP